MRVDDYFRQRSPELLTQAQNAVRSLAEAPTQAVVEQSHHAEQISRVRSQQAVLRSGHPDQQIPTVTLLGLRRSWATRASSAGIEIYTHVTRPMQSDAAEGVASKILPRATG